MNLFGEINEESKFRTLGFYEPFGSLMLCDKIETRWVRKNKKPPFPIGKYLFYTTQKDCNNMTLFNWCGAEIMLSISEALGTNKKPTLLGYAIAIGELVEVSVLKPTDKNTFVKFIGKEVRKDKNGKEHTYIQWGLHFKNVKKIEPFEWNFGKQGVGFVPYSELEKIKII